MTVFIHAKSWCPLEPKAERLVIQGSGAFTPPQLTELKFKTKYDEITGVAFPGEGDKDSPAIGICRCNNDARVNQFYSLVPDWLAAQSSSVSESEASGEDGDTKPETDADASQSGQPKPRGGKSKKGGE